MMHKYIMAKIGREAKNVNLGKNLNFAEKIGEYINFVEIGENMQFASLA